MEGIAIILGVERILDMCRRVIKVNDDTFYVMVVVSTGGEL